MKYETEINFDFENTMSIMISEIEPDSTILEFGPASGRLTKYLKEEMNCEVYIVELDEQAGKMAAQYAKDYVIGNIEDYEWTVRFKGVSFDYILFADVLEHLFSGEKVLECAKQMLKPEGYIIMSLPNIAHNSIIIDLLDNKFEYKDTGLLDNTHVRFFTYDNIENMLKRLSLYVDMKCATYTQVGFNEFKNTYEEIKHVNPLALKTRKMAEIYQFVYKVSPSQKVRNIDRIQYYTDYYYAQYFFDGENENKEIIIPDGRLHELQIKIPSGTRKLRFDPLNKKCIIEIVSVTGSNSDGTGSELQCGSTSAYYLSGNSYYFNDDDSQMYYEVENCNEVSIRYRVVDAEKIGNEDFLQKLIKMCEERRITIEQKENYICEQRERLEEKENYICEQRERLEEKEKQRQEEIGRLTEEKDEIIRRLNSEADYLREYREFVMKVLPVKVLYKIEEKMKAKRQEKHNRQNQSGKTGQKKDSAKKQTKSATSGDKKEKRQEG